MVQLCKEIKVSPEEMRAAYCGALIEEGKKNPKVVAVCASEQACSLEDAILIAFLNLLGFDIALFVPTGYQTIERYFNEGLPVEHQVGDYLYDLRIPDFNTISVPKGRSWLENILKRGI